MGEQYQECARCLLKSWCLNDDGTELDLSQFFLQLSSESPVSLGSRGFQSVSLAGQDVGRLGEGENRSCVSDVS